jgi:hypothetical protein
MLSAEISSQAFAATLQSKTFCFWGMDSSERTQPRQDCPLAWGRLSCREFRFTSWQTSSKDSLKVLICQAFLRQPLPAFLALRVPSADVPFPQARLQSALSAPSRAC